MSKFMFGPSSTRHRQAAAQLLVLSIGMLLAAASSASEYYTWVDENGVTNYAERNPQGYNARLITKQRRFGERYQAETPAAPTTVASASSTSIDPDALVADQRAALEAEVAQTKASNCKIGRDNLVRLQAFARIRVRGDDGQERVLSPEEKQSKMDDARKIIQDNC
ncbi:MAG: DUF4124 domain-containing protein [Pseudomonadota bacterium]